MGDPPLSSSTFPRTFRTARLLLRPINADDARPIFAGYARDPDVSRHLVWRPHVTIGETEAYVRVAMAATSSRTYVIVGQNDGDQNEGGQNEGKVIGAFDLRRPDRSRIEFGYVLARSCWGNGLMTEILTHVVDWALREPGVWRIGGVCDIDNPASARVMEKAGLLREGILRRWSLLPNIADEPRDCWSYAAVR